MRFACLLLLGACSTGPVLPEPVEVGTNAVAVTSFADQLYWIEGSDPFVVHGPTGVLWQGSYYPDRRTFYLVAGEQGVVMSSVNVFENCGDTIWIHEGGSAERLPISNTSACFAKPFDQAFGGLLYEISTPSRVVQRFDLATQTIEPAFEIGSDQMWAYATIVDEVFALGNGPPGEQQAVFAFDRAHPTSRRAVVHDLQVGSSLAVLGDYVYWVAAGPATTRFVKRAPAAATDAVPETVASFDEEILAMTAVRGSLWLALKSGLARLDADGSITRFAVPYLGRWLFSVGEQLAVVTPDEPRRLLLQPLDER